MKKTLLAAALALGFTGVAQAETSVTLYGILDGGIGWTDVEGARGLNAAGRTATAGQAYTARDGDRFGAISGVQSGNRWGLRGTEDLGNGLQAVFQLESGFDLATGNQAQGNADNDRLFGRHATLGLQSDAWGRLDIGRQTNITSKYFGGIANPFADAFGQAGVANTFGNSSTVRWDNMVMYQTPNFSGFQFGIGYSFNTSGSQDFDWDDAVDSNNKGLTAGLRYANGPIGAALTYDQVTNDSVEADADTDKVKAWNVALSYDFEVVKLHAGFGQTRDGWIGTNSLNGIYLRDGNTGVVNGLGGASSGGVFYRDGFDANSYTAGLSAPVGAGRVMFAWNMLDIDGFEGNSFEKAHTYSLGYTYPLSKRTNVYAVGSYATDVYGQEDAKSKMIGLGLRHQF